MTAVDSAANSARLAGAISDFWLSFSGALLGAAMGAYVSAKIAAGQQHVSAQVADGRAAAALERSAAHFGSLANSLLTAIVGIVVVVALLLFWRMRSRS